MLSYKRKRFFTHRNYQLRYTSYIIAAMISVAAAISVLTFTLAYPLLSSRLSEAVTKSISMDVAKGLLLPYWTGVIILIVIAGAAGILFSHRIVGPVNRMAALISLMDEGDISKRLVLRDKDEFLPLAGAINRLLENFSGTVKVSRDNSRRLGAELEDLEKLLKNKKAFESDIENKISSITAKKEAIYQELSKYKS
ncbi:MAG: methyl-accepting chemotaxis protein [Elusimicrobiota bacterium]|nr:methyl-accepting chemotaxis protein [Elusimicrobiota bacterium]